MKVSGKIGPIVMILLVFIILDCDFCQAKLLKSYMNFNALFDRKLQQEDAVVLAKHDLLKFARYNFYDINNNTWQAIKDINPNIEILVYIQGVDSWRSWDSAGTKLLSKDPIIEINNVDRYDISRGHSMGNLNDNNPDLFLLNSSGQRCNTYDHNNRFLMDFGSTKWAEYWIEAVENDIINQPWKADGIFLDNTGPIITFPTDTPVKYNTPEKWASATLQYVNTVSSELHSEGQKVMINAGGTSQNGSVAIFEAMDNSPYPPDFIGEEGTFAHSWGSSADTFFISEEKWKNSVECLRNATNYSPVYESHTNLDRDETGRDQEGNSVTFWQTFWYGMCSFLLGKTDNSYFLFWGEDRNKENWWFEEYEYIELGQPIGDYRIAAISGNNIYWREFEKGYVYVNPTWNNVNGIALPQASKQLNHNNFRGLYSAIPDISSIDLQSHNGTILIKSASSNCTMSQLLNYISQWKQGGLSMAVLLEKISKWKAGQAC